MRIATIIAVLLLGMAAAAPAAAQSDFCLPLQMELAALDRGGSSGGNDRSIRAELAQAREDARRSGCNAGLFSRKKGKSCGAVLSRISRLQRQLSSASRPRGFFFGRSSQERDRDRVLRALARAGCSQNYGTYRTICVRVCDGYYFPLSFAASRQRFAGDAEKCMSQYGPGEAVLYYHPNPGGDSSQAVSLSGERYFDQPYAFAYRQAFHPQCAARLHQGLAALGERVLASLPPPAAAFETAVAERMASASVPIPIPRADRASDPETVANRAGGLSLRPVPAGPVAHGGLSVRAVGDPYLFAEVNPGPPPTVSGFRPPELTDFRPALRASMLPSAR